MRTLIILMLMTVVAHAESLGDMARRAPGPALITAALVHEYDAHKSTLPAAYFTELEHTRSLGRWDQIREVDRWVNTHPYRMVHSDGDTVATFLRYGGSCKEYTLTKLVMLRELGVPISDMYIAAVMMPSGRESHEILLVRVDGALMALSNGMEPRMLAMTWFNDYQALWFAQVK